MMTGAIGLGRCGDVSSFGALSRRALLKGAAAIATTGPAHIARAFASPAVTPFTYQAPQSALDDLKQRLTRVRWPERETVTDWSQGVPLATVQKLSEY